MGVDVNVSSIEFGERGDIERAYKHSDFARLRHTFFILNTLSSSIEAVLERLNVFL